jgi:hypothetical protein
VLSFNITNPTSNTEHVSFNLSHPCVSHNKAFQPWGFCLSIINIVKNSRLSCLAATFLEATKYYSGLFRLAGLQKFEIFQLYLTKKKKKTMTQTRFMTSYSTIQHKELFNYSTHNFHLIILNTTFRK